MKLYLDSSALVKLVRREAESSPLRRFLRRHQDDGRVTSALARVEVVRAVTGGGPAAVAHARRQLAVWTRSISTESSWMKLRSWHQGVSCARSIPPTWRRRGPLVPTFAR